MSTFLIKDNPKYQQLLENIQEILANTNKGKNISIFSNFDDLLNQLNFDILFCGTDNNVATNILNASIDGHVKEMKELKFIGFDNILEFVKSLYELSNQNIYNVSFTELLEFNELAHNFMLYYKQFYCEICGKRIENDDKIITYSISDDKKEIKRQVHEKCLQEIEGY